MPGLRTSSSLELLVPLDRSAPEPLHRQLEQGLRSAVRDGRLPALAELPSSRALAAQLGVSRGIVVDAYAQLAAEGYLAARPGGATRVARTAAAAPAGRVNLEPQRFEFDFRPGRPDVTEFPRSVWLRSLRRALAQAPADRLNYLGGRPVPELGIALAAYLNRVRGTAADPADIVVSAGFAQALALVGRAMRQRGVRLVAVEDPSDPEYRAILRDAGLEPVGIPVDGHGIRVDRLVEIAAGGVVVTAAHQFPTGGVLPPDRRAALIEWAERRDALIVEDDYDAEFRYDREPIGALQGLSPDHVVYTGSASKILAPGLRLGWLLSPPALTDMLVAVKQAVDMGSPAMDQLAFADMLTRGELDHHLRRMRPVYRRRRDALLRALERHLPDLEPAGAAAGLHVLAWLPDDLDEAALIDAAAVEGIGFSGVTSRRIAPGSPALVFGYGSIAEGAIEPGVARLAGVIATMRGGPSASPPGLPPAPGWPPAPASAPAPGSGPRSGARAASR